MGKQVLQGQVELDSDYSLLMSTMGVSVSKHLLDEHYTVVWANDYYYDLIGYQKEEYEAIYHNQCSLYFKDDPYTWNLIVKMVEEAWAKGKNGYEIVIQMKRKDGSKIWTKIVASFTNEFHNGYPISYTVMTNVDDMVQKQIEQSITYDNLPGFVAKYRVNPSGFTLLDANDKFIDFFGLDKEHLSVYPAFSNLSPESRMVLDQHLPAILRGESAVNGQEAVDKVSASPVFISENRRSREIAFHLLLLTKNPAFSIPLKKDCDASGKRSKCFSENITVFR